MNDRDALFAAILAEPEDAVVAKTQPWEIGGGPRRLDPIGIRFRIERFCSGIVQ